MNIPKPQIPGISSMLGQSWYPPVSFHFAVYLVDGVMPTTALGLAKAALKAAIDSSFTDVSGINVEFDTESVTEGGENRFVHKLPVRTKYPNLVLKRGLVTTVSPLSQWCASTFEGNLDEPVEPKNVVVVLMNEYRLPSIAWAFYNAWPVKVQIADLQSMENKYAVETMELSYQYYETLSLASKLKI